MMNHLFLLGVEIMADKEITEMIFGGKDPVGLCDEVAALRFIASIYGQGGASSQFTDEECHGLNVILTMIADKIEGSAA